MLKRKMIHIAMFSFRFPNYICMHLENSTSDNAKMTNWIRWCYIEKNCFSAFTGTAEGAGSISWVSSSKGKSDGTASEQSWNTIASLAGEVPRSQSDRASVGRAWAETEGPPSFTYKPSRIESRLGGGVASHPPGEDQPPYLLDEESMWGRDCGKRRPHQKLMFFF